MTAICFFCFERRHEISSSKSIDSSSFSANRVVYKREKYFHTTTRMNSLKIRETRISFRWFQKKKMHSATFFLVLIMLAQLGRVTMVTADAESTMAAQGEYEALHPRQNNREGGSGHHRTAATTTVTEGECVADFGQNGIQCIDDEQQQGNKNDNNDKDPTSSTQQQQHTPPNRGIRRTLQHDTPAAAAARARGQHHRRRFQGGRGGRKLAMQSRKILHVDGAEENVEQENIEDDDFDVDEEYNDNDNNDDSSCTDLLGRYQCTQRIATDSNACILDFLYMQYNCRRTCLLCQEQENSSSIQNLYSDVAQDMSEPLRAEEKQALHNFLIHNVNEYMYKQVYMDLDGDTYNEQIRTTCKNRHQSCTYWAWLGECTANPAYMTVQCAPSCKSCEQVLFENRCPFNPDEMEIVWSRPGDLNSMFERIVAPDSYWNKHYQVTIHSQPNPPPSESSNTILQGPWVVTLDDFVNETECETLIAMGATRGYERSEDVKEEMNFDGTFDGVVSKDRTSTNAWCDSDECYHHVMSQSVLHRMEQLTNIPETNFEHLQLLRYEVGQFYGVHHDYIEIHAERAPGPRILTVFLYLNNVTAGGGTNFPLLNNLTIMPRQGRVLLWPSVLDESPMEKDYRTDHQALPVEEGIKYAANAWVHSRDWKTALSKNCH